MHHSEWELLCITEDIEPGDTIVVEEDGVESLMIFAKQKNVNIVLLKDAEGEVKQFSAQSLEEIGGNALIVGKSEEELELT